MKLLWGVHWFPFLSYAYNVRDLICGPTRMAIATIRCSALRLIAAVATQQPDLWYRHIPNAMYSF